MPNTRECVKRYEEGLSSGDLSNVPFADDATFRAVGRMEEPIRGKVAVVEFLSEVAKDLGDFRFKQYIVEGQHASALFEFEQRGVTIEGSDYFRVEDGRICEVRVFFDTRLLQED